MSNFEIIDDYLSNRLSEADKKTFESNVASDPSLGAEVQLQRQIVEGVRQARITELKAMLNNVPVGGSSGGFTLGKIAATVVTAGVIGTGIYFYFQPLVKEPVTSTTSTEIITSKTEKAKEEVKQAEKSITPEPVGKSSPSVVKPDHKQKDEKPLAATPADSKSETAPAPKSQPHIEVMDPSDELTDTKDKTIPAKERSTAMAIASRIAVDVDPSNKKYSFNYQFSKDKLVLYGPFDKTLYEVLEINGDRKSIFLYYKGDYYLLNEHQTTITPLEPIRDATLLKKLKEYRGQ